MATTERRYRVLMVSAEAYAVLRDVWGNWDQDSAKQHYAATLSGVLATLESARTMLCARDDWAAAAALRVTANRLRAMGHDELAEGLRYVNGAYREVTDEMVAVHP
jgi:uncharacterized protein YbjT (DUF2867 family)